MPVDESLATEALSLADGTDIHRVTGLVAMYRVVAKSGCETTEFERELHSFVIRKRAARFGGFDNGSRK